MIIPIVAADITKWVAFGSVIVKKIWGFNNQGADVFVQLHQSPFVSNNDVPVAKSLWTSQAAGFMWNFGSGLNLSELTIAMSSTETLLTKVAAAGGLDLSAEVETDFPVTSATAVAGDLTTGVASLQVWASGASIKKKLLRLDVANNGATDAAALIQSSDASSTGETNHMIKVVASGYVQSWFGKGGLYTYRKDADATEHKGCTIRMAGCAPALARPAVISAATDFNIRAIYENL